MRAGMRRAKLAPRVSLCTIRSKTDRATDQVRYSFHTRYESRSIADQDPGARPDLYRVKSIANQYERVSWGIPKSKTRHIVEIRLDGDRSPLSLILADHFPHHHTAHGYLITRTVISTALPICVTRDLPRSPNVNVQHTNGHLCLPIPLRLFSTCCSNGNFP